MGFEDNKEDHPNIAKDEQQQITPSQAGRPLTSVLTTQTNVMAAARTTERTGQRRF
jgi:hypothetical protein